MAVNKKRVSRTKKVNPSKLRTRKIQRGGGEGPHTKFNAPHAGKPPKKSFLRRWFSRKQEKPIAPKEEPYAHLSRQSRGSSAYSVYSTLAEATRNPKGAPPPVPTSPRPNLTQGEAPLPPPPRNRPVLPKSNPIASSLAELGAVSTTDPNLGKYVSVNAILARKAAQRAAEASQGPVYASLAFPEKSSTTTMPRKSEQVINSSVSPPGSNEQSIARTLAEQGISTRTIKEEVVQSNLKQMSSLSSTKKLGKTRQQILSTKLLEENPILAKIKRHEELVKSGNKAKDTERLGLKMEIERYRLPDNTHPSVVNEFLNYKQKIRGRLNSSNRELLASAQASGPKMAGSNGTKLQATTLPEQAPRPRSSNLPSNANHSKALQKIMKARSAEAEYYRGLRDKHLTESQNANQPNYKRDRLKKWGINNSNTRNTNTIEKEIVTKIIGDFGLDERHINNPTIRGMILEDEPDALIDKPSNANNVKAKKKAAREDISTFIFSEQSVHNKLKTPPKPRYSNEQLQKLRQQLTPD